MANWMHRVSGGIAHWLAIGGKWMHACCCGDSSSTPSSSAPSSSAPSSSAPSSSAPASSTPSSSAPASSTSTPGGWNGAGYYCTRQYQDCSEVGNPETCASVSDYCYYWGGPNYYPTVDSPYCVNPGSLPALYMWCEILSGPYADGCEGRC